MIKCKDSIFLIFVGNPSISLLKIRLSLGILLDHTTCTFNVPVLPDDSNHAILAKDY
jgi:hypothetical protein